MTPDDARVFASAMAVLAEVLNEPMSTVRIKAYFEDLSDYELPAVCAALAEARRTCKWFPKPAEVRALLEGRAEDGAEVAWAAIQREIRRVGYLGVPALDDRALRAVNELWGGWRRLCETLPGEGPELVGWIKQFKATYASVERREKAEALTMKALHPSVRALLRAR